MGCCGCDQALLWCLRRLRSVLQEACRPRPLLAMAGPPWHPRPGQLQVSRRGRGFWVLYVCVCVCVLGGRGEPCLALTSVAAACGGSSPMTHQPSSHQPNSHHMGCAAVAAIKPCVVLTAAAALCAAGGMPPPPSPGPHGGYGGGPPGGPPRMGGAFPPQGGWVQCIEICRLKFASQN